MSLCIQINTPGLYEAACIMCTFLWCIRRCRTSLNIIYHLTYRRNHHTVWSALPTGGNLLRLRNNGGPCGWEMITFIHKMTSNCSQCLIRRMKNLVHLIIFNSSEIQVRLSSFLESHFHTHSEFVFYYHWFWDWRHLFGLLVDVFLTVVIFVIFLSFVGLFRGLSRFYGQLRSLLPPPLKCGNSVLITTIMSSIT